MVGELDDVLMVDVNLNQSGSCFGGEPLLLYQQAVIYSTVTLTTGDGDK